MSNLDPYDVLGISHNATWNDIKKAYKKMLINTHPDKMNGSAKYFMLVHEAFNDIQKQFKGKAKISNAPKEKQEYKQDQIVLVDLLNHQKQMLLHEWWILKWLLRQY